MIKAHTDINQSKKLAGILPLESADMHYNNGSCRGVDYTEHFSAELMPYREALHLMKIHKTNFMFQVIPCWSLAALLDILESEIDGEKGETYQLNIEKDGTWWNVWYREQYDEANPIETESTEDLIDACYEMVLKLNELNLL